MPHVTVADAQPARFDGDFSIATASGADAAETAYVAALSQVLGDLATDESKDVTGGFTPARLEKRRELRKAAAAKLRKEAQDYAGGNLILATAADNVRFYQGRYAAERDSVGKPLFQVGLVIADPQANLATDVRIDLNPHLPAPDNVPSQAQQDLFVQIDGASTVIRTVCKQMYERASDGEARAAADKLQDTYIRKLEKIARVGLEGPFTQIGVSALNELRNEFVAQNAGRIKNAYVRSLGLACLVAAVPLLLWYAGIVNNPQPHGWWYGHRMFIVAGAGAAIGTWLSFSVRRVTLAFADLAILEEDLLDPSVRVVFVVGLTIVACLLFWTGVMNIQIGNLKTNADVFKDTGSVALLIGIFCGLSERALATAISGRAAAFVKGVAGGS